MLILTSCVPCERKNSLCFFPTLHGYLAEHAYRVSDMDTYPIHVRYVSNKYPIFINLKKQIRVLIRIWLLDTAYHRFVAAGRGRSGGGGGPAERRGGG